MNFLHLSSAYIFPNRSSKISDSFGRSDSIKYDNLIDDLFLHNSSDIFF